MRAGGLERVQTMPMGVEPGIFSPARRNSGLRARMLERCQLPEDALLLVGVGRHAPEKRWPQVIEAVTAAGYRHPVGLVLVGDGRDRARVQRAAMHNPHIHLLAPTRDRAVLADLLASADALVHGCEAETFCMVAAEGRASGLPLIVPDEGGASDQVAPGLGVLYRAGATDSLAAAVGAFAADRTAYRTRAAQAAAGVMTMDGHFDALFDAYASLTQARRHAA
jgi:alpha-1,6-mannosyltransferase